MPSRWWDWLKERTGFLHDCRSAKKVNRKTSCVPLLTRILLMRKLRLGVSWWFAEVHGGSWHFIWRELWFYLLYICVFVRFSPCVFLVTQLCPTLCDPMASSPPASSVHGILQARILEWVANLFLGESSQPRDRTQVSCVAGRFFTVLERT